MPRSSACLGTEYGSRQMTTGFRKTASPSAIATEVASLSWLADAAGANGAPVAEVLGHGRDWLETRQLRHGSPNADQARTFGERLAMTHAAGADFFGAAPPGLAAGSAVLAELPSPVVEHPTYESWGAFFAKLRLVPHMKQAENDGVFDADQAEHVWSVIARVASGEFDSDQPAAVRAAHRERTATGGQPAVARLHGDLWGGNVVWAVDASGVAGTLIDPSAHGGHAETDLAELAVFGSPHLTDTIAGYHDVSPLADGWRERVPVHQLHMLLVHVVKFGAGYVPRTMSLTRDIG